MILGELLIFKCYVNNNYLNIIIKILILLIANIANIANTSNNILNNNNNNDTKPQKICIQKQYL